MKKSYVRPEAEMKKFQLTESIAKCSLQKKECKRVWPFNENKPSAPCGDDIS